MENIKLQKVRNIRDLAEVDSKEIKIKPCYFLRAASLYNFSDSDIKVLKEDYHLSTIIDLRTDTEKKEKPDIKISGVTYYEIPIFDEAMLGITHETFVNRRKNFEEILPDMRNLYKLMVSGECLEKIKKIIRIILDMEENSYSVLFHCTEGKDRTGIIAAILCLIVGIDREKIMEDYLYTNTVATKKAKQYYWLVILFKRNRELARKVKDIFLVKEEYLQAVFEVIDQEWEGTDSFIEKALEITAEERKKFVDKVTIQSDL